MDKKELRGRGARQAVPRLSIGVVLVLVAVFALACGGSDIDTAGQVLDDQGERAVAVADGDAHEGVHRPARSRKMLPHPPANSH